MAGMFGGWSERKCPGKCTRANVWEEFFEGGIFGKERTGE